MQCAPTRRGRCRAQRQIDKQSANIPIEHVAGKKSVKITMREAHNNVSIKHNKQAKDSIHPRQLNYQ